MTSNLKPYWIYSENIILIQKVNFNILCPHSIIYRIYVRKYHAVALYYSFPFVHVTCEVWQKKNSSVSSVPMTVLWILLLSYTTISSPGNTSPLRQLTCQGQWWWWALQIHAVQWSHTEKSENCLGQGWSHSCQYCPPFLQLAGLICASSTQSLISRQLWSFTFQLWLNASAT